MQNIRLLEGVDWFSYGRIKTRNLFDLTRIQQGYTDENIDITYTMTQTLTYIIYTGRERDREIIQ